MLKINKKVEYALIALKLMLEKEQGELTTAREVSDKFHTPFDTTAKVMQMMNSARMLESVKGVKGGYYLSCDLSNVSYMDLAEMIEGKSLSIDCETVKCSLLGSCNISGPIKKLDQYLNVFFRDLSVKELLLEDNSIDLSARVLRKETQHEL
tara:strand:+ start:619 stop:1074 length:456 start_codon:yes stop_codon:yes gene_type:complete